MKSKLQKRTYRKNRSVFLRQQMLKLMNQSFLKKMKEIKSIQEMKRVMKNLKNKKNNHILIMMEKMIIKRKKVKMTEMKLDRRIHLLFPNLLRAIEIGKR